MKHTLGLLLLCILLLTVCGCQKQQENDRGALKVDSVTATPDTRKETDVNAHSDQTLPQKGLPLGTIDGNVYECDFIGVGCKLDDGWSFFDDVQIREANRYVNDVTKPEHEVLVDDNWLVMYATDAQQHHSMSITIQKMDPRTYATLDFVKNSEKLFPILTAALEDAGYQNIIYENRSIEVDGEISYATYSAAEYNGVVVYQISFPVKCHGYVADVGVCTDIDEPTLFRFIDNFYWLEP